MNETIYIQHCWQIKNVITGYEYHREASSSYRILTPIYVLLGIISLMLGLYGLLAHFKLKSILAIIYGAFYLSINEINRLLFVNKCKKLNYENTPLEWEINQNFIIYRMEDLFKSTFEWEFIKVILDTPDGFLIYPRPNVYYWLPKSAFSSKENIAFFVFVAQNKVRKFEQIK